MPSPACISRRQFGKSPVTLPKHFRIADYENLPGAVYSMKKIEINPSVTAITMMSSGTPTRT